MAKKVIVQGYGTDIQIIPLLKIENPSLDYEFLYLEDVIPKEKWDILQTKYKEDGTDIEQNISAKELQNPYAIIWAPHPIPQPPINWFEKLSKEGYNGKKILLYSGGGDNFSDDTIAKYKKSVDHSLVLLPEPEDIIEILEGKLKC